MTPEQKLQRIIERAIDRGWVPEDTFIKNPVSVSYSKSGVSLEAAETSDGWKAGSNMSWRSLFDDRHKIIFFHPFLKAYFGEDGDEYESRERDFYFNGDDWKFHAMRLAITPEEDRIDYLYKFVDNKDYE